MVLYEIQVWCKTGPQGTKWSPMSVAFNREQALGQVWFARQILRKQGFKVCRMRIRPAVLKRTKGGSRRGKRKG